MKRLIASMEKIRETMKELESQPGKGEALKSLHRATHELLGNEALEHFPGLRKTTQRFKNVVTAAREQKFARDNTFLERISSLEQEMENFIKKGSI